MAKHSYSRQEGTPPVADVAPKAAADPLVSTVGIRRSEGMWIAERVTSQGDRVLKTEVICGPDIKAICLDRAVRHLEETL